MIPEALSAALRSPLATAVAGAAAALLLVPLAMVGARRLGFVAQPREDRWHERPTVLMGGIGIYLAVSVAWLAAPGVGSTGLVIWAAGTVMFATGLIDDVRDISPATKLVAQLAAASLLFYGGFQVDLGGMQWVAFPATLFWVVAVTNAVNLLDNMDGLAAGVTAIAAASLGVLAALGGDPGTAALALGITGAAAGFLVYNFNPARVFMGDCGSLFLGFSVAALALAVPVGGPAPGIGLVLLVPAAVMAVPIFDTTLVTIKRLLSGRRISQGGRDHSSHRLVWLGLSERRAVLTLYAISALFGGSRWALPASSIASAGTMRSRSPTERWWGCPYREIDSVVPLNGIAGISRVSRCFTSASVSRSTQSAVCVFSSSVAFIWRAGPGGRTSAAALVR